ncbi:hypothetical protein GNF64_15575 [Clostridium perfringens]|nr:hypothetical protein [Clostridium perfringens]
MEVSILIGVLLVSHGDYAKAMNESIDLIVGKRENFYCIGLQANDN